MSPFNILIFTIILGLIFDYTNGFHDAANVVSTVIATKVMRPLIAILLAAALNFIGAMQINKVAETITTGLVSLGSTSQITIICALIGAILWNLATWYFAVPSSSSYALVGGLIGSSLMSSGVSVVLWNSLIQKVMIPMILSPICGFFLGLLLMKGLGWLMKFPKIRNNKKIFARLQIGSASVVALAHGLNDAQKSMAIITLGLVAFGTLSTPIIPVWVIISCAIVMGLGTASGGFRIIHTVGYKITALEPIQGFAAETSASCVILTASFLGMPISSTHMIVGSVAGVGASKGALEVSWPTIKKLVMAWILTLPGSGLIAAFMTWLIS